MPERATSKRRGEESAEAVRAASSIGRNGSETYRSREPASGKGPNIPKSGGGFRELGIPSALDRFVQQAILQVLQPMFDPTFSEHSHGFRPGANVPGAGRVDHRYIHESERRI